MNDTTASYTASEMDEGFQDVELDPDKSAGLDHGGGCELRHGALRSKRGK